MLDLLGQIRLTSAGQVTLVWASQGHQVPTCSALLLCWKPWGLNGGVWQPRLRFAAVGRHETA